MVDNSGTSALISGGTQGLGMAVAKCLLKQGCTSLTITGRNTDRGEAAAAQLRDAGSDCRSTWLKVGQRCTTGPRSDLNVHCVSPHVWTMSWTRKASKHLISCDDPLAGDDSFVATP